MSMPRCPDPYGESGGSNPRITGPTTGHCQGIGWADTAVDPPSAEVTKSATAETIEISQVTTATLPGGD
jgi:hypothetical protein